MDLLFPEVLWAMLDRFPALVLNRLAKTCRTLHLECNANANARSMFLLVSENYYPPVQTRRFHLEECRLVRYLPKDALHLKFGDGANAPVSKESWPPTITTIVFGNAFNNAVDGLLPAALTHLTFGDEFNQTVDALPAGLLRLVFGKRFRQSVDKLPPKLEHLSLGHKWRGTCYHLPQSLVFLKLDVKATCAIHSMPTALHTLVYHASYTHKHLSLPPRLSRLYILGSFNLHVDALPPLLTVLVFFKDFNQLVDNLPQTLKTLVLGDNFNQTIDFLPKGLVHLELGREFSKSLRRLPNIKTLVWGCASGDLHPTPASLEHLVITGFGFRPMVHPKSITRLTLHNAAGAREQSFDMNLPGVCVTHITIATKMVRIKSLPRTLLELDAAHLVLYEPPDSMCFEAGFLPPTLQRLSIPTTLSLPFAVPSKCIVQTFHGTDHIAGEPVKPVVKSGSPYRILDEYVLDGVKWCTMCK